MPRRIAIVTASVRSLTWSLEEYFARASLPYLPQSRARWRFPCFASLGHERQHLEFARADRLVSHVLGQLLRHRGRKAALSPVNAADGF